MTATQIVPRVGPPLNQDPPNTGVKLRSSNMFGFVCFIPLFGGSSHSTSQAKQCHPASSASLAFTSLRTRVADNGSRAENRMVPGLVSYSDNSTRRVATVVPLIG
jgi:hypothetical protein